MRLSLTTLLVPLILALDARGQDPVEAEWNRQMTRSSQRLKSGDYKGALKVSTSVAEDMVERLGPGEPATRAFCIVLTQRAVALVGLGREEEALWYWHTVLSLYPSFARSDLSMYGRPGYFLSEHPLLPMPQGPSVDPPNAASPPKELAKPNPVFPRGARLFRTTGTLVVQVLITEAGTVSSPRVITPLPAATLSYAALEAIHRWRYAPATVNGTPVAVPLTVSVTFRFE